MSTNRLKSTAKKDEKTIQNDAGLRIVVWTMIISLVGMTIISLWSGFQKGVNVLFILGLSSLIGLAAMIVGGLLGFLFGIPRSLQRATEDTTVAITSTERAVQRAYSNNTNLEQISDWLTKIIVGVGLTQIPEISQQFQRITSGAAKGFVPYLSLGFGRTYATAIITFYLIAGFLTVYIWAKIYFLKQLNDLEREIDGTGIRGEVQEVKKQGARLELSRLEQIMSDFNRMKIRVLNMESQSPYKEMIDTAKPDAIKYIADVQKERWGGKSIDGGYVLSARYVQTPGTAEVLFDVTITVKPVSPDIPLTGTVLFLLHESFENDYLMASEANDNEATITFTSYEAFTIAAICNRGEIKLELDLNLDFNCPQNYKYATTLLTVDEVQQEIEKLRNSQGA